MPSRRAPRRPRSRGRARCACRRRGALARPLRAGGRRAIAARRESRRRRRTAPRTRRRWDLPDRARLRASRASRRHDACADHDGRKCASKRGRRERLAAGGTRSGRTRRCRGAPRAPDLARASPCSATTASIVDELFGAKLLEPPGVDPGRVEAGQRVEGDIERIEEPAVRGREGAAVLRSGGKERVQRVEPDEVGAFGAGERGERGEIGEVADAPIAGGAELIEVDGHAPRAAAFEPVGKEAGLAGGCAEARHRVVRRRRQAGQAAPGRVDGTPKAARSARVALRSSDLAADALVFVGRVEYRLARSFSCVVMRRLQHEENGPGSGGTRPIRRFARHVDATSGGPGQGRRFVGEVCAKAQDGLPELPVDRQSPAVLHQDGPRVALNIGEVRHDLGLANVGGARARSPAIRAVRPHRGVPVDLRGRIRRGVVGVGDPAARMADPRKRRSAGIRGDVPRAPGRRDRRGSR